MKANLAASRAHKRACSAQQPQKTQKRFGSGLISFSLIAPRYFWIVNSLVSFHVCVSLGIIFWFLYILFVHYSFFLFIVLSSFSFSLCFCNFVFVSPIAHLTCVLLSPSLTCSWLFVDDAVLFCLRFVILTRPLLLRVRSPLWSKVSLRKKNYQDSYIRIRSAFALFLCFFLCFFVSLSLCLFVSCFCFFVSLFFLCFLSLLVSFFFPPLLIGVQEGNGKRTHEVNNFLFSFNLKQKQQQKRSTSPYEH